MKISERTTYGFLFMLHLATSDKTEYIKLNEITDKEKISIKYLENIVSRLRSAGLIEAKKGSAGGYKLNNNPELINLYELFQLLNGTVNKSKTGKLNSKKTVVAELWNELSATMIEQLKSKTLQDLVDRLQDNNDVPMYVI
jgi:Rrf2 family protein